MMRRIRLMGLAALVVAAGCGWFGDDGGAGLALAGSAEFDPQGDEVTATRISAPSADRLSLLVVVENASEATIDTGLVVGDVFDGAGARITQGTGTVQAPRHIEPGGIGIARVDFPTPLPDPFTVEWAVSDGEGEADRFDLPMTRFELSGGQVRADVKNNRDGFVIVVEIRVLCLDQAGQPIELLAIAGPAGRVPSDGEVTIEGPVPAECTGAIGGAVARNF